MEKNYANVATESSITQDYKFDMNYLLNHLKSYDWSCTSFVVYHPNKEIAETFLNFIEDKFPQVMGKRRAILNDRDQFDFGRTELLNFGQVNYYLKTNDGNKESRKIFWIDLLNVEVNSKKHFDEISLWRAYGKAVEDKYGF